MENTYKTNDIKLASYLFVKGVKYLGVDKEPANGKFRYSFTFENENLCQVLSLDYINDAEAPARKLFEAREIFLSEVRK